MKIDKVIRSKHLKPPPRIEFHHTKNYVLSKWCKYKSTKLYEDRWTKINDPTIISSK